ncbi:MAG: hypothetical protein WBN04_16210, partial [Paracoccaceae bacterium]
MITMAIASLLVGCNGHSSKKEQAQRNLEVAVEITDNQLLDSVQKQTFDYFWEGAEPISGLARERIHLDNIYPAHDKDIITIGGSGFGLRARLVGVERGFITREQALERYEKAIAFLTKA